MRIEDYLDMEAVESDEYSDDYPPTSRKRRLSSSEEESEDEEKIKEEMKDLINDEDEDEYESVVEQVSSDGLDELVDDDIDMLEENTGRKFNRKKLLKRVRVESDDEVDFRTSQNPPQIAVSDKKRQKRTLEEEDDMSDFVVDEYGKPYLDGRNDFVDDEQLAEAQRIFGVDYDSEDQESLNFEFVAEDKDLVKNTDLPERFQGRGTFEVSAEELEEETTWIYKNAFFNRPLSNITHETTKELLHSEAEFTSRIKKVLHLLHNSKSEVPFIAVYRKEVFMPVLSECDLWSIYDWDDRWRHFTSFRTSVVSLFTRMRQFLEAKYDSRGLISDVILRRVESSEDEMVLRDWHAYLLLHYGHEIEGMNDYFSTSEVVKSAQRRSTHRICTEDGLGEITERCGFNSETMAGVFSGEVDFSSVVLDENESPMEMAEKYVGSRYESKEQVLKAVVYMLSTEISTEPSVLKFWRENYLKKALLCVKLTPSGMKEMDEGHPCYPMRYLRNKPISKLEDEDFLYLTCAESNGLVKLSFSFEDTSSFYELFKRGGDGEWNNLRTLALTSAVERIIFPKMAKELREGLTSEASNSVIWKCCERLSDIIEEGPYFGCSRTRENKAEKTVLAVAYTSSRDIASYGVVVDLDGEVVEVIKLACLVEGRNSPFLPHKKKSLEKLSSLIETCKPSVIIVSTEDRLATFVLEDIRRLAESVEGEIRVELVDNQLPKIYSLSKKSVMDFPDHPELAKEAISMARLLIDPVAEYSQLVNKQEDYLSYQYHRLQHHVKRDLLARHLQRRVINVVNRTGVDINRARHYPHAYNLLHFVAGLGPRKSEMFMKDEYRDVICRTELVTNYKIGPTVFVNCSGFLLINQYYCVNNGLYSDQFEPLDYYRIHPEAYHWARKMVVDALDYEDARDVDNSLIIDELMNSKDKLRDLDLEAFSEELEKQNFGSKIETLLDIREQLSEEGTDGGFRVISSHDLFYKLLKETPDTLFIGKLVTCRVVGYARRRCTPEQAKAVRPRRSPETELLQCPFCRRSTFEDIEEVRRHLEDCPGSAVGLRVAFDSGLVGFIHSRNVSDRRFDSLEKIKIGSVVCARVVKFNYAKIQCELISKGSVLNDKGGLYRIQNDDYYDYDTEEREKKTRSERRKKKLTKGYTSRPIMHPNYREVSYRKSCQLLKDMQIGDCLFRPSSRGTSHLTMSWKVAEGIYSHVDIVESGKESSDLRLGKVLKIDGEVFEDLEEIISRYLRSMVIYIRDIVNFQYFIDGDDGRQMERYLLAEKKRQPNRIPYGVSLLKDYPCKAVICYFVNNTVRKEYISATWKGIKFRSKLFRTVKHTVDHFKAVLSGRS